MKGRTGPLERGTHEPRTEEWAEPEPAGEDQPIARLTAEGPPAGGTPAGMEPGDVEGRSELARNLQPSVFPAPAAQLAASAMELNAPDHIVSALRGLPPDRVYENVQELWHDLGGGTEQPSWRS